MCVRVRVQVCVWLDPGGRLQSDGFSGSQGQIQGAHRAASGPAGGHGAAGAVWRERKTPAEHDRVSDMRTNTHTQI